MIQAGIYHTLKAARKTDFGFYLTDGTEEVLLPNRFVPNGLKEGDELEVFIYHDSDNRLTATTQRPKGVVGEIVLLPAVSLTPQGAFLDWGLMKDLFVPKSQQVARMHQGQSYLVLIYLDEQTGRVAATEKFQHYLSNETLTVGEMEEVQLTVWQKTDIGYKMIINHRHTGVLHYNEIFRELKYGERLQGFIKHISPDHKIDLVAGAPGYKRVINEKERILELLRGHDGYLPYNDKSAAEDVYRFFGMSKKTFKMTLGNLYKEKKISFTQTGIKLEEEQQ
jgi:predicted RNA-binding protein (virulence factor B family)